MKLSFIIPCYRSEHTLSAVVEELEQTMTQRPELDYEIVLTEDGSPDRVWDVIAKLADGCVFVIRQDYADISILREGMDMFSGTGCKLLGCVLNHADAGGGYGYGRYGYGRYGYGRYGYGKSGYGYGYGETNE